jgi:hypothetical protein
VVKGMCRVLGGEAHVQYNLQSISAVVAINISTQQKLPSIRSSVNVTMCHFRHTLQS